VSSFDSWLDHFLAQSEFSRDAVNERAVAEAAHISLFLLSATPERDSANLVRSAAIRRLEYRRGDSLGKLSMFSHVVNSPLDISYAGIFVSGNKRSISSAHVRQQQACDARSAFSSSAMRSATALDAASIQVISMVCELLN
jgi:hypothetical protein